MSDVMQNRVNWIKKKKKEEKKVWLKLQYQQLWRCILELIYAKLLFGGLTNEFSPFCARLVREYDTTAHI